MLPEPSSATRAFRWTPSYAHERNGSDSSSITLPAVGDAILDAVEEARLSIRSLAQSGDRLDAFSRFSDIEQRIEAFERDIAPLVVFVDRMVEEEIGRRRSK